MFLLRQVSVFLVLCTLSSTLGDEEDYESNIYFNYYKTKNILTSRSNNPLENVSLATGADPKGKVTIIIHGYSEDCYEPWVTQMLCNFNTYRPGATFCMDYSYYANTTQLMGFFRNMSSVTEVFTRKVQQMELQGFDLSQFVVFAFSAGTMIAVDGGTALGGRIGQMFTCEYVSAIFAGAQKHNPKTSAKRVQGIHTSNIVGTAHYNNHVDFILGHCGHYQDAKCGDLSFSDHRMCPYFFNCAFKNPFWATTPSAECYIPGLSNYHRSPNNYYYRMGWQGDNIEVPDGIYYANTTVEAPYNAVNKACAAVLPTLSPCCSACQ